MDKDELIARYKELPLYARLLIWLVIGLLPGAYYYMEDGVAFEEQLTAADRAKSTARSKFSKATRQRKNLPKLEEQLQLTEDQLEKARKQLPDEFRIDDTLHQAATIARDVGVFLSLFHPQKESQQGTDFRYVELPISATVRGKYSQIGAFFDRLVHLDTSVFVRNIILSTAVANQPRAPAPGNAQNGQNGQNGQDGQNEVVVSEEERAREARDAVRIDAAFDIVIYRAMDDGDQQGKRVGQADMEQVKTAIAKINAEQEGRPQ